MLRLLIGCTALAALSCSDPGYDAENAATRSAIYGGGPSGPEDDFVVRLEAVNAVGLRVDCSGVAIAPRLVLTARHCLIHSNPPPFQCGSDGELVSFGEGGKFGTALEPEEVKVFAGPGYPLDVSARGARMFAPDTPTVCRDDLAFLLIDSPLDVPRVPLRLIEPTTPGELVSVIGYGFGDPGAQEQFRKRVSGIVVEAVGPETVDPEDDSQIPPRSFAVGRSTCGGDSGGPAISEPTGAVIGVASLNSTDCTFSEVRNIFARLAPHAELAAEAFAAAESEPWIEGAAQPGTSETCAECDSGCAVPRGKSSVGFSSILFALCLLRMRMAGARSKALR